MPVKAIQKGCLDGSPGGTPAICSGDPVLIPARIIYPMSLSSLSLTPSFVYSLSNTPFSLCTLNAIMQKSVFVLVAYGNKLNMF